MEREQIEAFLSVVNDGTISSAANSLYTTQSSISKRINMLEDEAGVPFLLRGKGSRKIKLTPHGEAFLSIARKWETLNREFTSLKYISEVHEVSIGATDIINRITLKDIYRDILSTRPDYRLDLHNHHSAQLYRMIESSLLDLGYVSRLLPVFGIKAKKLFDEKLVVLIHTHQKLPQVISCKDLDPAKEIYSRWNDEFEIWHEQYFPHRMYRLRVGTASMIADYLNESGRWTIAPVSCIHGLRSMCDFQFAQLDIDTPKRPIYLLEQKTPNPSRAEYISWVKNTIHEYIKKICMSINT